MNEDGFFWLALAALATLIGAGVSAYSSIQQGQMQSQMATYNALIAKRNADLQATQAELALKGKKIEEIKQQKKAQEVLGAQVTGYSKAGVQAEGTPLIAQSELMTESKLDALAIRYASSIEQSQALARESGLRQEAMLQEMAGKQYEQAGYWKAGGSLLTGIASAGGYLGAKP